MTHTTPHKESKYDEPSCKCEPIKTIPYLDTQCQIKEGKTITGLYRKPTERNQYLLQSSCHPTDVKESIPYSLSLIIVRTCMEPEDRDARFVELKDMLLTPWLHIPDHKSSYSQSQGHP